MSLPSIVMKFSLGRHANAKRRKYEQRCLCCVKLNQRGVSCKVRSRWKDVVCVSFVLLIVLFPHCSVLQGRVHTACTTKKKQLQHTQLTSLTRFVLPQPFISVYCFFPEFSHHPSLYWNSSSGDAGFPHTIQCVTLCLQVSGFRNTTFVTNLTPSLAQSLHYFLRWVFQEPWVNF